MKKINKAYTYDETRKLGALIPLEVEVRANKEKEIPQVIINEVRLSRGESFWTRKEIKVLRTSALCEISHYYQALKANVLDQKKEALLNNLKIDREKIALEIMKGLTVDEAFKKCCEDMNFDALKSHQTSLKD